VNICIARRNYGGVPFGQVFLLKRFRLLGHVMINLVGLIAKTDLGIPIILCDLSVCQILT
jgi:hypothetical protein